MNKLNKFFLNNPKLISFADKTYDFIVDIQPFLVKPSIGSTLHALSNLFMKVIDRNMITTNSYFEQRENGWIRLPYDSVSNIIINVFKQNYNVNCFSGKKSIFVVNVASVENIEFAWTSTKHHGNDSDIYVKAETFDQAIQIVQTVLKKHFSNKQLTLTIDNKNCLHLFEDKLVNSLPCKQADEILVYLQKAKNSKINRSLMLYGPPGTGKSTMSRYICNKLNFSYLRLSKIHDVHYSLYDQILTCVQPDAIIIDDFDKMSSSSSRELLELFHNITPLIIVSANNISDLDQSLLRPGRIDELILVEKLDKEIIENILGEYKDEYEAVQNWPVVYIKEYILRRKILTAQAALNSMIELNKRIDLAKEKFYQEHDSLLNVQALT